MMGRKHSTTRVTSECFGHDGRVEELKLEEFGLTGAVPAEVGRLSALRGLDLNVNQLTSVPEEIGQLTSLEVLDLECNELTSAAIS